jgi:4-hydroxy-tetrahydrodipicolinate synthase
MKLSGLYTAMITPFTHKREINWDGIRENIRFQLKSGVQGLVILGTTGEAPTLRAEEKEKIIQVTVEEAKGKAAILVGTGSYSTEQTIASTLLAERLGADGALIVTPYYNKPTQEGLYQHFAAICRATSLPVCVYNIQGRTGQNLQTKTLIRLTDFPSIIGVKEASGSISQINDVLEILTKVRPDFSVLSGDDELTLPLMALGGQGVISVVSNLVPSVVLELVKAASIEDFTLAREWHYRLLALFKVAFIETNPIPIKSAMQLCGLPAGPCRLPLCDLEPANFQQLEEIINVLPTDWIREYGQTKSPSC